MKRIILDGNKNFYKANLHCHSVKSDGEMTVEEVKEYHKQKGYSIVAFTDHDFLFDNCHLSDDEFLAINACEISIKEDENVSTLVKTDMKVCHLNLYAKDPENTETPCYNTVYARHIDDDIKKNAQKIYEEFKREYSAKGISEIIRIANEKGFLVCYNHPRWSLENATDYLGYRGLWAVEIYNHGSNLTGIYEYDINTYDDFLRDGQKLACVSADDSHRPDEIGGGYVMINAESLDYARIIDALEKHNFYSTMGPVIKDLYIEDDEAYITVEDAEYVTLSTKGRRAQRQRVPEDEKILRFKIQSNDGYIRFDVVDKYGKRANTNAIWL